MLQMTRFKVVLLITVWVNLGISREGQANGAFPDSLAIFVPSNRPHEIAVATNFGLLVSSDDGHSWDWVCEEVIGPMAALYQMGPQPSNNIFSVTEEGLARTNNMGCNWQLATGTFADYSVIDAFPDPTNAQHVVLLAQPSNFEGDGFVPYCVFESNDGGQTFEETLLSVEGGFLRSQEIARSDANTMYVTGYENSESYLMHSQDAGITWTKSNYGTTLDSSLIAIITIDPNDATTLYFRVRGGNNGYERLAVSRDAGATIQVLLELRSAMSAFLYRPDGTLIVASSNGEAFISSDHGANFMSWGTGIHWRGLGERNGAIYAVGDDVLDPFAVGVSFDDGATWHTLLQFDQIRGPMNCGTIPTACAAPWSVLKTKLGIDDSSVPQPSPSIAQDPVKPQPTGFTPALSTTATHEPDAKAEKINTGCSALRVGNPLFSIDILALVVGRYALSRRRSRSRGVPRRLISENLNIQG